VQKRRKSYVYSHTCIFWGTKAWLWLFYTNKTCSSLDRLIKVLCIDWFLLLRTGIDTKGLHTVKLSITFCDVFKDLPTESTCNTLAVPSLIFLLLGHTFSYLAVTPILVGDTNAQYSSLVPYLKIPSTLRHYLIIPNWCTQL